MKMYAAAASLMMLTGACRAAPTQQPNRIVAIGDLHADLPAALSTLQMAGLIDASGTWIGGSDTLVQTGDITDRGPDSLELIELFDRLEDEAEAAGGQVIALMGNHEMMNLVGDWRYVSPEDIADFGSVEARKAAFAPDGALGSWLMKRDAVAQVEGIVFAHGGVSARYAGQGAKALSAQVRGALTGQGTPDVLSEEGPMWYRGYLQAPEPIACEELTRALTAMGANRMIVGHTTQSSGQVASRCGGALLGIDTGISSHYGGHHSAVQIRSGDAVAIYPHGQVDLPDPATATAP
ncbi:MAG: hypothetical protein ACI8RZ_007313 [Myxococcota bacterium]|jgi:hypothetical protein